MNAFEEFYNRPEGERPTEPTKAAKASRISKALKASETPAGFTEAIRDISAFMRREAETEWTEWLQRIEERRVGRLARNKQFGAHRNPETQRKKAQRKRLMQKLRDKQIFARVEKVGVHGLDEEERTAFEVAKSRQRRKTKQHDRRLLKDAQEPRGGSL